MQTQQATIAQVIHSIGDDEFPRVAAHAVCRFAGFELATIVTHRANAAPALLFDNFDQVGGRRGVQNYLLFTHRLNPMIERVQGCGVFRARDFGGVHRRIREDLKPYVEVVPEEELGFRTLGWPERCEEVGLYFRACGGLVELGIYREKKRTPARTEELEHLCEPLAAAFHRHADLRQQPIRTRVPLAEALSPREEQIADLLLIGCATEAIALRLALSPHTVKDYRKQIFRKLRIGSLAELFALYRSAGGQGGSLTTC